METIILAAYLYAQLPLCQKAFIKNWQDNRQYALMHLPKRACRYKAETGTYICSKRGCERP